MESFTAWVLFLGSCYMVFILAFMDTSNANTLAQLLWKVCPILLLVGMLISWMMTLGFVIAPA